MRRAALDQLPKTLNETYERLLLRVHETNVPLVLASLRWIAYANPSLNTSQLVDILALSEDGILDLDARPDPEDVFRLCGSLIRRTEDQRTPELAHFTVLQYLEAIKSQDERINRFRLSSDDVKILANLRIKYLCAPTFSNLPPTGPEYVEQRNRDFPFYRSAALYNPIKEGLISQGDVLEPMKMLFNPKKTLNFSFWLLAFLSSKLDYFDRGRELDFDVLVARCYSSDVQPLHVAAMLNYDPVCQWLLDCHCDVNKVSSLGSPLECSVLGSLIVPIVMLEEDHEGSGEYFWGEKWFDRESRIHTIEVLLKGGATCDIAPVYKSLCAAHIGVDLLVSLLRSGMPLGKDVVRTWVDRIEEDELRQIMSSDDPIDAVDPTVQEMLYSLSQGFALDARKLAIRSPGIMKDDVFFQSILFAVRFNQGDRFLELCSDPRFSVDITEPDRSGTLLHLGAEYDATLIFEKLLDLEHDLGKTDDNGENVWHTAARSGSSSVLKVLI